MFLFTHDYFKQAGLVAVASISTVAAFCARYNFRPQQMSNLAEQVRFCCGRCNLEVSGSARVCVKG